VKFLEQIIEAIATRWFIKGQGNEVVGFALFLVRWSCQVCCNI